MHIVFITTDFIEKKGPTTGLPKYLLRVSTALIRMGHEVSIITGFNHTVFYEFSGINVYRIRRPAMKQYSERRKNTIAECLRDGQILNQALVELYKKEKIDIVQSTLHSEHLYGFIKSFLEFFKEFICFVTFHVKCSEIIHIKYLNLFLRKSCQGSLNLLNITMPLYHI